jgi:nitroreductase
LKAAHRLAYGTGMTSLNDRSSLLAFLKSRKSASAKALGPPGPDPGQLAEILSIAVRVPDHGKLAPWRFVVFAGAARARAGEALGARYQELHPAHGAEGTSFAKGLLLRAPVVVAVVSKAAVHPKIPLWEQQLSSGAVCFNLVLASQALGFDAQWQTDWIAYDDGAKAIIGLAPGEAISGFIYIGTSTVPLEDRPRPDLAALVTHWGG